MLSDGTCTHGIPIDEPCLLCRNNEQEKPRDVRLPTTFEDDIAALVWALESSAVWLTAASLAFDLGGISLRRFNPTYIRHLAKAARGRVISGQRGYKATKHATGDEVREAASAYMKAAKGCLERRRDILRVFHKGAPNKRRENPVNDEQTTVATS